MSLPAHRPDLTPVPLDDDVRVVGYAYDRLDAAKAEVARAAAERIRGRLKVTARAVIEVGIEFQAVKNQIPHGEFGPWAVAELGMSERTVQNYMSAAAEFRDNIETVAALPVTTVYALAAPSTPDAVRQEVIRRIEAGDRPEPAAIRETIAAAKKAEREAAHRTKADPEMLAQQSRKDEKVRKARERREAKERAQLKAEHQRVESAAEEVAGLIADRLENDIVAVLASIEDYGVWDRVRIRLRAIGVERQASATAGRDALRR